MTLQSVIPTLVIFIKIFSAGVDQDQVNEGRLMGRVTDYNGKPVAAATVFASGPTSKAVLTNAQGYYVFLAVPEGKYNLKVFKRGLPRLKTNKVYVPSEITIRRDFTFITKSQQQILLAKKEKNRIRRKEEKKRLLAERQKKIEENEQIVKPVVDSKSKPSVPEKPSYTSTDIAMKPETNESASNDAITDIGLKAAAEAAVQAEKSAYDFVEKQVKINGGLSAVIKQIVYPDIAKKLKIEGLVVARVYVDSDGSLTRIDLLKQAHELLDEEAVRVLSEETVFAPAVRDGKNVAGALTIPIKFKIAKVVW